jgi:hypothetical protein
MKTTQKGWHKMLLLGMSAMALACGVMMAGCTNATGGGGGDNQPATPPISLNQSGTYTFPAAALGYAAQTAKSITITNTGNQATGALTAALSGDNSGNFTLSTMVISSIAVGETGAFTVAPNTGLALGTYTATVTVSGNGITANFVVSFTVNLPGTAKVMYAWVNENDQIVTSSGALTLSRGANESLTMSVTGSGYLSYRWYYNGVVTGRTANSYTFNSAGKDNGNYNIGLQVWKDAVWYSTLITITVIN